jgi:HAD superfamily hydrolase (TIGR01450 family)
MIDVDSIARADPAAILVDMDGTLLIGRQPVRGAAELLARYSDRAAIITNNSADTTTVIARRLRHLGLPVRAEQVFSAGTLMIDHVASRHLGDRVMAVTSQVLKRQARARGLLLVDTDPHVVLVARDRAFNYAKLTAAANALRHGAILIAANPDTSHPGPNGRLVPETGAIVASLTAICGPIDVEVIGKPSPLIAEAALAYLGARAAESIVIGDNPATDGRVAEAIGAAFVPVLPSARAIAVSSAFPRSPGRSAADCRPSAGHRPGHNS